MPIPEAEIARLKASVSLAALVRSRGIELKPVGNDLMGLCPFHAEKTASFSVTPSTNLFHCFGCGAAGDAFNFLMKLDGIDFPEAVRRLSQSSGKTAHNASVVPQKKSVGLLEPEIQETVRHVMDAYRKNLGNSPVAQEYLLSRGLTARAFERIPAGYADGSLLRLVPSRETEEGQRLYARLCEIGIITQNGRELFHGYVVMAVLDVHGSIVQLYGRRISKNASRPDHLYLCAHAGILNPQCLSADCVIVTESPIDALSYLAAGVPNVTCNFGTNGFSRKLAALFREHGVGRVQIAFDADAAGEKAASSFAALLLETGIESQRVYFPEGMDPNDVLVRDGAEALAATVAPPVPCAEPVREGASGAVRTQGQTLFCLKGDRAYRMDGFFKNLSAVSLSVTMSVSRRAAALDQPAAAVAAQKQFKDRLDLYVSKDRERFTAKAARKLDLKDEIIEEDLDGLVSELEKMQDTLIEASEKPPGEKEEFVIPPDRLLRARELLENPAYFSLISKHALACGLIGEETNVLLGYLILLSRVLSKPLHGMAKSSSASGKSTLLDLIARFCPPEDLIRLSALSNNALYYMEDLRHKVIVLEEDAGLELAGYPLKILQTEGVLRKGTVFRDPQTGKSVTFQTETQGPVATLVASTQTGESEEQDNRYVLLGLNESVEQTSAILEYQRMLETIDQEELEERTKRICELHQDCLRLLKNHSAINPYAGRITLLISRHRFRRDQPKLLKIIRLVTLLHQYQRPRHVSAKNGRTKESILSTIEDNVTGLRLARVALGRSLDDLPPHTRHFLLQFSDLAKEAAEQAGTQIHLCRFLRRDLMRKTGLSRSQVHRHLYVLQDMDYVTVRRDDHGRSVYQLLYEGEPEGGTFFPGIADEQTLRLDLETFKKEQRQRSSGAAWWEPGPRLDLDAL